MHARLPPGHHAGMAGCRDRDAVPQRGVQIPGAGLNRWGRKVPTLFHTSHPGLAAALRRDRNWRQCSAVLCGGSKARSRESVKQSAIRNGREKSTIIGAGYGGHFRAVQGFKFITPCES